RAYNPHYVDIVGSLAWADAKSGSITLCYFLNFNRLTAPVFSLRICNIYMPAGKVLTLIEALPLFKAMASILVVNHFFPVTSNTLTITLSVAVKAGLRYNIELVTGFGKMV